MELYEKIYVKPDFLKTTHGQIPCEKCHGGNPADPNWQTAHEGIVRDPTFPDPSGTCGECHKETVETAVKSLHYTLAPFEKTILKRAGKCARADKLKNAMDRHCNTCHSSCGQCHVSRPDYVDGGFLGGHMFKKNPPMDTTCASCHGGRVHGDFTGAEEDQEADVHYDSEEMECMDCHTGLEMHAAADGLDTRYQLKERPDCIDCHDDVVSDDPKTKAHAQHKDKVACQVCHSQATKNCFSCHTGTDKKGLPYFKCEKSEFMFKIGLNNSKTKERPYEFVVLRHPPTNPQVFEFYSKCPLKEFTALPTWKTDTPHNILRKTPQNQKCNNCHGNKKLFLTAGDLKGWELEANKNVLVPEARIPKPVQENEEEK